MKAVIAAGLALAAFVAGIARAEIEWTGYQPQALRWNEDFSAQCKSALADGLLQLKCVPLSADGANASFGANYRWRIDHYDPANVGLRGADEFSSIQNRALLHADLRFNSQFRLFAQVGAAEEHSRPLPRPGDEDDFDVVQAFADFGASANGTQWRVRAGRQELPIGRFSAIRDSTNFRRTFDGLRVDVTRNADSLLFAIAQVTALQKGSLDNEPDAGDRFVALVLTHALQRVAGCKVDLALVERDNDRAIYLAGSGEERRRTVGLRLAGGTGAWDVDAQASYQFGSLQRRGSDLDIDAWGVAIEGGVTMKQLAWSPRLAIRIDAASGDRHEGDARLNTFDLPYPNLAYLSDAAVFAPRNVWNVQPFIAATFYRQLTVTAGTQLLWRVSRNDAVYSSANAALIGADGAGDSIASQPYLRLSWRPVALISVQATLENVLVREVPRAAGARDETYGSVSVALEI